MPPSAKPIVPARTTLKGQVSVAFCICIGVVSEKF